MDLLALRTIERIVVEVCAVFVIYLGYRLYVRGLDKGDYKVASSSRLLSVAVSGTGPGLAFMAMGAMILVAGICIRGTALEIERHVPIVASEGSTIVPASASQEREKITKRNVEDFYLDRRVAAPEASRKQEAESGAATDADKRSNDLQNRTIRGIARFFTLVQ